MIKTLHYTARLSETEQSAATPDAQAALRQFSLERMLAYGIDYSDAVELRARVLRGDDWQKAAADLANRCETLSLPDTCPTPTRICRLHRASALLRMSLALTVQDTDAKRAVFAKAAMLYREAAALAGHCNPVRIETPGGPLLGWHYPAKGRPRAAVIIIGGIEGWSMDFDSQGLAFAERGIEALMLDGPGQGETRHAHGHYLTAEWPAAYGAAIDFLHQRAGGLPMGCVGHSMGGSFAMAIANQDPRIVACCNNGGPFAPWMVPQGTTFFSRMVAYCGVETADQALDIWQTVKPIAPGPNAAYPLLVVQGGEDPMVTAPIAQRLYDASPTPDKRMVIFSDGDHCIYRHRQDRDILITDWMLEQLTGRS